jgi:1-acyl-sn-glycerol-3-phosphate acyltransferase
VQYRVSRILAGPFLHGLWRPKITGVEHVPASGGAIIASNHLSILDSVFLPLMLARPVTFVSKSEHFSGKGLVGRLWGAYLKATKQLSVEREGARAAQDMLDAALTLLQRGDLFGIYPEGSRSPDGRLYRGRVGVGYLALESRLPVVPVAMVGTRHVLPPGRAVPRLGSVEIRIGKPLTFPAEAGQQAPARARRAVTDEVMRAIQELSGQEYAPIYVSARKAELASQQSIPTDH